MRILILTNNPERASFRQRFGVYIDILDQHGIHCQVARLSKGRTRRGVLKSASEYDGVILHKKGLNLFDARRLRKHARKIIYNYDDAVMLSPSNPERYSRSHNVPFRRSVSIADMVLCGSQYLADFAKDLNNNIQILPIGLDSSSYQVLADKPQDKTRLVWIGSAGTMHYLESIRDPLEEIGRRTENVILRVICEKFPAYKHLEVEERVWSAETRGMDLATSDIGLAPLVDEPFARGKCSFKVLEYSASGLPVIASPVGTNSVHVQNDISGYLVTESGQWVDKCIQLIENPDLRQSMGRKGRTVAEKHDIGTIGARFAHLIRACVESSVQ